MTDPLERPALLATLFDAKGNDRQIKVGSEPDLVGRVGEHQLLWIDVDDRDERAMAALQQAIELPADSMQLLAERHGDPQVLRYGDRVHLRLIAMQPADRTPGRRSRSESALPQAAPIDILVAANTVVTVHAGEIAAFDDFLRHIRGDTRLGVLQAADLLTVLVDSVLAVYLELVEAIVRRVDALDEVAIRAAGDRRFLEEVVRLRRRVANLRRTLAPHRWAFAPLARPDFELEGLGKPWPALVERLDRTMEAVESARELLIGAFDVYMASAAQRTNDVMKTLTILSAILLPAVVLAGVMGMNFKIDFFETPDNFWLAVLAMLTLAVGVLGISRWRGWI